ncbi:MAG TPA: hypothetical protein VHF51_14995 [Solirubrobacteraceae bacterium]|nr:hypothetical protein [Solirubrobacteraceae bacterium]
MPLTPPDAAGTYRERLRQYERRETMVRWVGAGLGGLIALAVGGLDDDLIGDAPEWLAALITTSIVLAGGALARARIKFEWAATQLRRDVEDGVAAPAANLAADRHDWPDDGELAWLVGLVAAFLSGVAYVIAIWLGVG